MRDKAVTKDYYINQLGFDAPDEIDYEGYLMVCKDNIEIHFFEYKELNPSESYSGVYIRTDNVEDLYQSLLAANVPLHPNAPLEIKPWGQKEFAVLDPDNNLLTFGQAV